MEDWLPKLSSSQLVGLTPCAKRIFRDYNRALVLKHPRTSYLTSFYNSRNLNYLETYADHLGRKVTKPSPLTLQTARKRLYFSDFKERLVHFNGTVVTCGLQRTQSGPRASQPLPLRPSLCCQHYTLSAYHHSPSHNCNTALAAVAWLSPWTSATTTYIRAAGLYDIGIMIFVLQ